MNRLALALLAAIKFDHFLGVCKHAIAAFHAFRHLQAFFGMLGPKAGFLSFCRLSSQVYQITLYLGFRGEHV